MNQLIEVEEPLKLITNVISSIESGHFMATPSPDIAFYLGMETNSVYLEDLLNEPSLAFKLNISYPKLVRMLEQHTKPFEK
jgi:hypothetical protein